MLFGKEKQEWVNNHGTFTATEIFQQPSTWRKTIKQVEDAKVEIAKFMANVTSKDDYDIILTGAGTSEFVGNALYSYLNKLTNYKIKSYATTDLVATPQNYLSATKPTLLISFGRSGNSPESVAAVDVADTVCGSNVYHLFVTCNHNGALSKACESKSNAYAINLTSETHDQGFAMTSSFTNMMLATLLCFELDNLGQVKKELEDVINSCEKMLETHYQAFEMIAKDFAFNRIVYLGANTLKGIAQESQLKMLELTAGKVVTMYDSPMGFRHGPKSIINDETLCVVYLSDDAYTRQYEVDLIKEMSGQRKGNKIMAIMNKEDSEVSKLVDYSFSFNMNEKHDNILLGFAYVCAAQLLAVYKSLSFDITPDNPCPSGEVNRVVQGVIIHTYSKK